MHWREVVVLLTIFIHGMGLALVFNRFAGVSKGKLFVVLCVLWKNLKALH